VAVALALMTGGCRLLVARNPADVTPTATAQPSAVTVSTAREKSASNLKCPVSELAALIARPSTYYILDDKITFNTRMEKWRSFK